MSIVKLNDRSIKDVTAFGSLSSFGNLVHIATQTASSSSSISFTSGIDSTYKEYIFYFVDIHASGSGADFSFQADTGTNTNYNQTITSSIFRAYHNEAGNDSALGYMAGIDITQGTGFQSLVDDTGHDTDNCMVGFLHIFNPSSSVFVKHFLSQTQNVIDTYSQTFNIGGYFNTTTPLTRFQFKMSSGNIDSGQILLFGLN